ncbi:molybdopterin molybdotransferase MoeA [Demequina globuliformis]|uniref:molybdopterin molybdotransferase MoeA n=1 Tax=Demequina globuliformis TaxID=676202 RepID=UPI0013792746|nr:gephyrin-like molybdotransferase Glp [Demequina globuliformis]
MTVHSLADYKRVVSAALGRNPALDVLIADAVGGTLAEDVVAARDLPAAPVSACDGYAVAAADVTADHALVVSHDVSFDDRSPRTHVPGTAARVPSGGPLPRGADAVVPSDRTDGGVARVIIDGHVTPGQNVRPEGSDVRAGEMLVAAGTRLGPRQVAAAAAMGRPRLRVHPVPRVVIVAVGDELIDPGARRPGGGVPDANSHLLAGLVRDAGAQAYRVGPVPDEPLALRAALEDQLVRADVLLTTGGLSQGTRDTVASVMARLGNFELSDVALYPGRRMGLGAIDMGPRHIPVVALPGSPAAAAVMFEACVRPALRDMCGFHQRERDAMVATVGQGWSAREGHVNAVPVALRRTDEGRVATPIGDGTLSLASLAKADALAWTGPETAEVEPGMRVHCSRW